MQVLDSSWASEPAGAERMENKLACESNPRVAPQHHTTAVGAALLSTVPWLHGRDPRSNTAAEALAS